MFPLRLMDTSKDICSSSNEIKTDALQNLVFVLRICLCYFIYLIYMCKDLLCHPIEVTDLSLSLSLSHLYSYNTVHFSKRCLCFFCSCSQTTNEMHHTRYSTSKVISEYILVGIPYNTKLY